MSNPTDTIVKHYRGRKPFTLNGDELNINVCSFWQWGVSNLLDNVVRGAVAEYIVVCAIVVDARKREEWEPYDLLLDG
ncbi:MAG: hypothetical protein ACPG8W_08035 [Candidatus Promineifilaceae bacterium]